MESSKRYNVLDFIRGVALIGMVIVHTLMNMVHQFDYNIEWYVKIEDIFYKYGGCIFILLAGFCWKLSRNNLKRGILMLTFSAIISAVTIIFMPENTILFGVICLMGTASIVMIPLDKICKHTNPYIGFFTNIVIFVITKWTDYGYIGIGENRILEYPESWYANNFTAFLGFPEAEFASADYFPVIPWLFLFVTGYFLYGIFKRNNWFGCLKPSILKPVEWVGRHSLVIYLAHQPIIYAVLILIS
ncbi:MAG: DUF1624 domain-containing protein [Clostridia bacterium]|nr:DUF1624 domain-containing protein [Clostridia bacterium]